jgi:hypothetical protein
MLPCSSAGAGGSPASAAGGASAVAFTPPSFEAADADAAGQGEAELWEATVDAGASGAPAGSAAAAVEGTPGGFSGALTGGSPSHATTEADACRAATTANTNARFIVISTQ